MHWSQVLRRGLSSFTLPVSNFTQDFSSLRVAVVGRPNVGKSTLFNRLACHKVSLVSKTPGMTRDRIATDAKLYDLRFTIVDTPGLDRTDADAEELLYQTSCAIQQADITLFTIDGAEGSTPLDEQFALWIRKHIRKDYIAKNRVLLVANKCESSRRFAVSRWGSWEEEDSEHSNAQWDDIFRLGFGEPVLLSAEHGDGMENLYMRLLPLLQDCLAVKSRSGIKDPRDIAYEDSSLSLAIVGRPNTGKSTLVNRVVKENRCRTGPTPGITRDPIAIPLEYNKHKFRLIDTAGLAGVTRLSFKKVSEPEAMAMGRSLQAIRFANVVALVVDSHDSVQISRNSYEIHIPRRERSIAQFVIDEGRALLVIMNKWDMIPKHLDRDIRKNVEQTWQNLIPDAKGLKVITMSALDGMRVNDLLPCCIKLHDVWNKRVSTGLLNRWLDEMKRFYLPSTHSKIRGQTKSSGQKIKYITQVKSRPPTFAIFGSRMKENSSFMRYIVNSLRKEFDLEGVPIRVLCRTPENPFKKSVKSLPK